MNTERLFRTLVLGCAMLLLWMLPVQAQDQAEATTERSAPTWVENFGKQLKTSLESEDPRIKQQALHHITYFASFYEEGIDFSDAVPTLVKLYQRDDDANVRLNALVALYTIGDEEGMQEVRGSMYAQRWPPRLQLVTLSALVSYYGAETFNMDKEAADMAKRLITYYTPKPQIEIGPLEMVRAEPEEEQ